MFGNHVPSTARTYLAGNEVELLLCSWCEYVLVSLQKLEDIILTHLFEETHGETIVSVEERGQ